MSSWRDRVQDELNDLEIKIDRLANFVHGDSFNLSSYTQQGLLKYQLFLMRNYADVLKMRLADEPNR